MSRRFKKITRAIIIIELMVLNLIWLYFYTEPKREQNRQIEMTRDKEKVLQQQLTAEEKRYITDFSDFYSTYILEDARLLEKYYEYSDRGDLEGVFLTMDELLENHRQVENYGSYTLVPDIFMPCYLQMVNYSEAFTAYIHHFKVAEAELASEAYNRSYETYQLMKEEYSKVPTEYEWLLPDEEITELEWD